MKEVEAVFLGFLEGRLADLVAKLRGILTDQLVVPVVVNRVGPEHAHDVAVEEVLEQRVFLAARSLVAHGLISRT